MCCCCEEKEMKFLLVKKLNLLIDVMFIVFKPERGKKMRGGGELDHSTLPKSLI